MPHELLKRIIEQASHSLAEGVYLRMLMDRRAAGGQLPLCGTVPTWEDLLARAVEEATLTEEEAGRLLDGLRNGWLPGAPIARARSSGRQPADRTPDRTGGNRQRVRQASPGKASSDQQPQ